MTVKRSFRGPFLSCSAYPKCRNTKPVPEELKEKIKHLMPAPAKKATPAIEVSETCPECGCANEAAAQPTRLFPRLYQVSQVPGDARSVAGVAGEGARSRSDMRSRIMG